MEENAGVFTEFIKGKSKGSWEAERENITFQFMYPLKLFLLHEFITFLTVTTQIPWKNDC